MSFNDIRVQPAYHTPVKTPTPYLDRELPLPGPNRKYRHISLWQTVLIFLSFVLLIPLAAYLLLLSVVLFHEVGHCIGGLLVGLEFDGIRVGPIELDRHHRLRWSWQWNTIATGYARCLPRKQPFVPVRLALFVLAGPLTNIAAGVLILWLYPDGDSVVFGLGQVFAAGCLVIGLANLVPANYSGVASDGLRLLMLLSKKKRNRWIYLLNWMAALKQGIALETQSTEVLSSFEDSTADHVVANWAAYTVNHAGGNDELASRHLEACLARCSAATPDLREEIILAAARFQAMKRKRLDLAREWLASGDPTKAKINRVCTEAIILYCEGQNKEALVKIAEGEKLVELMPPSPSRSKQEKAWRDLRATFMRMQGTAETG